MKLNGQVALVTGSATGIGKATALALATEGASIVINYLDLEPEATETATMVEGMGRRALMIKADVSRENEVLSVVEETVGTFGRLDILVNCAGTTNFVDFRDLDGVTDEMWDRILGVNLKGTFFCSRAAGKVMVQDGAGCIVNVASISGLRPLGSSIPYAASKAGVISLTKSLAVALAPQVRVNAVAPGFVDTQWHAGRPGARQRAEANCRLCRICLPDDIAEVIVGLVANSGFVTGQTVVVDGGQFL